MEVFRAHTLDYHLTHAGFVELAELAKIPLGDINSIELEICPRQARIRPVCECNHEE